MANSNVNIASRLFAYIKHGVDISPEIKEVYNQSLIVIGDEKQIYVPIYDAYVGIGMTSYNITNERIDDVSYRLDQLANTLSQDLVSKIYPNYSLEEYQKYTGDASPDPIKMNNEITIKGLGNYDPSTGLARTSYVVGQGAANPMTVQRNTNGNTPELFDDTQVYANSGITITAHYGGVQEFENPQTGQIIKKQVGNYITIDDKQTWSYMTSAYSYTLNYTQQYTNSEIDRLYHNLLGQSSYVFVPVSIDSVFKKVDQKFDSEEVTDADAISNNQYDWSVTTGTAPNEVTKYYSYIIPSDIVKIGNVYYRYEDRDYYIRKNEDNATPYTIYNPDYAEFNNGVLVQDEYDAITDANVKANAQGGNAAAGYYVYDNDETARAIGVQGVYQFYVLEEEGVNTYNMNIRDGINTLKEVAYLLDKLTDGQLGKVTYITYAQYNDSNYIVKNANWDGTTNFAATWDEDGDGNEHTAVNVNLYLITPQNQKPKPNDIYAYVVNEVDPDNLGIQIAYSIAGNKTQIDDLHKHVELDEQGKTSLRSINTTYTELASIVMRGGYKSFDYASADEKAAGAYWTNTDTNQALEVDPLNNPNGNDALHHPDYQDGNKVDYRVGDVDIRLKLDTATTYATLNNVIPQTSADYVTEFGVHYKGSYQYADMTQLDANSTYYSYNTTTNQFDEVPAADLAAVDYDYTRLAAGTQYFWHPNTTATLEGNTNLTLSYIDAVALENAISDGTISNVAKVNSADYQYIFVKNDLSGEPEVISNGSTWLTGAKSYLQSNPGARLYYATKVEEFDVHPFVDPQKNQIATTDWVGAFVDAKVGDIGDELEDILEQAKQYTDNKIDALDTQYAYSDFEQNVWKPFNATENLVEGSDAYNAAYNSLYNNYVAGNSITYAYTTEGSFSFNDYADTLRNRVNSEYVYDVVEEDGIVTPKSRELPSDRIIVENNIWGHEDSDEPYVFAELSLGSGANDDALLAALYNWMNAAENDRPQNQLFVLDGYTFEQIPTSADLTAAPYNGQRYHYNSATGQYEVYAAPLGWTTDLYANTSHILWEQLYIAVPKYVELDLASGKLPGNEPGDVNTVNTLVFNQTWDPTANSNQGGWTGGYTIQKSGTTLTVSGNSCTIEVNSSDVELASAADLAKVYYISSGDEAIARAHKVQYLTAEEKHFDYSNGGNGENELKVRANIVKLEDAYADNTGFADAYDVKTYIDNLFRWVNISASVDSDTLVQRDVFFKHITYAEYDAMTTKPTLYVKTSQTNGITNTGSGIYRAIADGDIATGYYYYSDDVFDGALADAVSTSSNTGNRGTVTVGGTPCYSKIEFNAKGYSNYSTSQKYDTECNYYINIESASINPLNLTLTKFGE